MGPATRISAHSISRIGKGEGLSPSLSGTAALGTHDGLDRSLISVLQFGSKRGEICPNLDKGADAKASNKLTIHRHLAAVRGAPKKPSCHSEGLPSGDAEYAIEFFGQ